jgi:hypothetical protein
MTDPLASSSATTSALIIRNANRQVIETSLHWYKNRRSNPFKMILVVWHLDGLTSVGDWFSPDGISRTACSSAKETSKMPKSSFLLQVLCTVALTSATAGCHHSENPTPSETGSTSIDPAQDEFVRAFLTAHDNKDLEAEEKLVDWDDVTDSSRKHFIGDLKSGLDVKITAKVEDLPAVPPGFAALYNISPEKFLTVVYAYDDSRGAITVKFPIAKKDGRQYFALRKQ